MELIKGDCLQELKKIKERTIDCFISDLPYGTTACAWDNKIDLDDLWIELKRLARNNNTPFFFFCDMKLAVDIINSNRKWFRYDMVIQKSNVVGFLNAKRMPMREHELLLVFYKNLPVYNIEDNHEVKSIHRRKQPFNESIYGKVIRKEHKYYEPPLPRSILKTKNDSHNRNHPTEKSQDILSWIVKYYTKEDDTILDPTMGSGSTGVACGSLNRKFIGIELDTKYFDIAQKRLFK
tara:strand:+ start:1723 stop:2430 length:708 start_codon:yes stop_codon:yes gene_type:complete